jgi:hypothetical protein
MILGLGWIVFNSSSSFPSPNAMRASKCQGTKKDLKASIKAYLKVLGICYKAVVKIPLRGFGNQ